MTPQAFPGGGSKQVSQQDLGLGRDINGVSAHLQRSAVLKGNSHSNPFSRTNPLVLHSHKAKSWYFFPLHTLCRREPRCTPSLPELELVCKTDPVQKHAGGCRRGSNHVSSRPGWPEELAQAFRPRLLPIALGYQNARVGEQEVLT